MNTITVELLGTEITLTSDKDLDDLAAAALAYRTIALVANSLAAQAEAGIYPKGYGEVA